MNIKIIQTKKFKTINIDILFENKMSAETGFYKYLIGDLISNTCNKYPTKQDVSNKLSSMYGAYLNTKTSFNGKNQVLEVSCNAVDSCYIDEDRDLLREQFELLHDFIMDPNVKNNRFDDDQFNEAVRLDKGRYDRQNDEPGRYAMNELFSIGCKGSPLGFIPALNVDKLDKIKNEDVYAFYKQMLFNDRVDIIVIGDVDEDRIKELANEYFDFNNGGKIYYDYVIKKNKLPIMNYGQRDISQAYITMLYQTNIKRSDADYYAFRIGNGILGETPSSLLFQEVREKNSLCYSIYSAFVGTDGVMYIYTGVEENNIDKAVQLIEQQVSRIIRNDFTDEMIETSKKMLINMYRGIADSIDSTNTFEYQKILMNDDSSVDNIVDQIKAVNRQDIVDSFSKMNYITGYILKKGEE